MKKSNSKNPQISKSKSKSTPIPKIITLNCIEDTTLESTTLSTLATIDHVPLNNLADGRIETATAILLHSLAFLPRAAQRRLNPAQLILCLGSSDRAVDSALAADLGLNLVHVDVSRAMEVADTVMALVLGLLRRTHLLSRHSLSSSGWLGSVQPLCRGMRRCRGLVLGIVGRSAASKALASRSLAFQMNVLYFDVFQGQMSRSPISFPPAARRMETLNDLLAASDVISLHCALTDETVQIINSDCLQHIKPGSYLVNTGSSQLLDDCAVKELLIDGTLSGCALDGAEGPQWMEAWVREMPNVLVLPRSADYSEEVWLEIREKAISILQSYFMDGFVPTDAVSDEEEDNDINYENEQSDQQRISQSPVAEPLTIDSSAAESSQKKGLLQLDSPSQHQDNPAQFEGKNSRSSKKAKKRHARQKSQHKLEDSLEKEGTSHRDDSTAMSGIEQIQSSGSRDASPEVSRNRKTPSELVHESSSDLFQNSGKSIHRKSTQLIKDGCIIALHAREHSLLHVSRQRVKGGGWFLDTISNVTKRDPAAQFLVVFGSKDTMGLRSLAAGGKLLQINRKMEFVFASHSFDVWESWSLEGPLDECKLVNCRNTQAVLDVRIEVLATVGEDDGILRWLD